jgi:hypothetical protein
LIYFDPFGSPDPVRCHDVFKNTAKNVITRSSPIVITYLSECKANSATSLRVFAVFGQKSGIPWAFYIKQYQHLTKGRPRLGRALGGIRPMISMGCPKTARFE